jgi:hypothetical protein
LREDLAVLADALADVTCPLWALSLADTNLTPSALCKLLPTQVRLGQFRFVDLSHNQELFSSDPSAVSVLRRLVAPGCVIFLRGAVANVWLDTSPRCRA